MDKLEKRRAFIINFIFIAIWAVLIFCLLKYAMPLFMPFVMAYFIAFALKPLIRLLHKKTRINKKVISVILLVLLYAGVGTLLVLGGIRFFTWLGDWFANLPVYYNETIEPALSQLSDSIEAVVAPAGSEATTVLSNLNENISSTIGNVLSSVSSAAVNVITSGASSVPWAVAGIILCIIASFYFVVDYQNITNHLMWQLPRAAQDKLLSIKDFVVNVLFKFLRAYMILMSITFAEVSVGLLILRAPSPFLIALATAIVDILPVFGTGTILIPWAIYSLLDGNYFLGIGLIILYIAITVIRQTIEPRIVGKQIGLYPLLTLITMFIGARLFGFWGLFGFPITLTLLLQLNKQGQIHIFRTSRSGEETPTGEDAPPPETGDTAE